MIPEVQPVKIHYGNNLATKFDFDFYLESEDQLLVEHTNMAGLKTVLEYGVDFSVEEFGNPDGSKITFPLEDSTYSVLAWDDKTGQKEMLVISLDLPLAQEAEFDISGDLNKKNLETALDYEMRCIQILSRRMDRAVFVPEGYDRTPQQVMEDIFEAEKNVYINRDETKEFMNRAIESAEQANISATSAEEDRIATQQIYEQAVGEITSLHTQAKDDIEQGLVDITDLRQMAIDDLEFKKRETAQAIDSKVQTAQSTIEVTKDSALSVIQSNYHTTVNNMESTKNSCLQTIQDAEKAAIDNILGDTTYIIHRNWKV
ncbi:MAG: hypothetical protein J6V44_08980 [Methanobrevibacter sp.]|nr:hypothetical protein [Methanobrevibacter sp.]